MRHILEQYIHPRLLIFVSALIPCLPLLRYTQSFYWDWGSFLWLFSYEANYIHAQKHFPSVFHTYQTIGITAPLFYGKLILPILSFPTQWLGSAIVIRLAAFGLYTLQFVGIHGVLKRLKAHPILTWIIPMVSIWAIYPMTNLYSRSALAEFFGTGLLTVSFTSLCSGFLESKNKNKFLFFFITSIFLFLLAAGSHPITALLGLIFLSISAPITFFSFFKNLTSNKIIEIIAPIIITIILSIGAISPWIYVIEKFKPDLYIGQQISPHLSIYPFDTIESRFSLLPFDVRTVSEAPEKISTPYLDTQINVPLLMIFLSLIILSFKKLRKRNYFFLVFTLLLIYYLLLISIGNLLIPEFISSIQFGYRLITYINLLVLLGVFLSLNYSENETTITHTKLKIPLALILLVSIAISSNGILHKIKRSYSISKIAKKTFPNLEEENNKIGHTEKIYLGKSYNYPLENLNVPVTYSLFDYATPKLFSTHTFTHQKNEKILRFNPNAEKIFGKIASETLSLKSDSWVQTNVMAFPWNQIYIDEEIAKTTLSSDQLHIAFLGIKGTHHIKYKFNPDSAYLITEWIQRISFGLIALIYLNIFLIYVRSKNKKNYSLNIN